MKCTPDNWDWEHPMKLEPHAASARHVFSVQFSSADLTNVMEAAQARGVKTGRFIREAALAAVSPVVYMHFSGSSSVTYPPNETWTY